MTESTLVLFCRRPFPDAVGSLAMNRMARSSNDGCRGAVQRWLTPHESCFQVDREGAQGHVRKRGIAGSWELENSIVLIILTFSAFRTPFCLEGGLAVLSHAQFFYRPITCTDFREQPRGHMLTMDR